MESVESEVSMAQIGLRVLTTGLGPGQGQAGTGWVCGGAGRCKNGWSAN